MTARTIGILEAIGNTPLIELRTKKNLFAKLEMSNPGGSVKDRAALSIITDAENRGLLDSKTTVIEATSGNTGIALAMICAIRGYECFLAMPESMSIERRKIMQAYGAKIELTPPEKGMRGAIERIDELQHDIPKTFVASQFSNSANVAAHEFGTGPEIIEALEGKIDAFVAGIGTGGTITGVAKALKTAGIPARIIGIEPEESAVLSGKPSGKHGIQGIGAGFVPEILDLELLHEIRRIDTTTAIQAARLLAEKEGILGGISSGAAYWIATQITYELGENANVVTLFPDGGFKYLSTGLF